MGDRVVLAYGDSNTHGTMPMATLEDAGRWGPAERWPGVLAAELGAGWRVVEEGLPGRTTVHPDPIAGVHKNGLALLPAALESHRPIDLVVLMLGTNDLQAALRVPPVEIGESVSAAAAPDPAQLHGAGGRAAADAAGGAAAGRGGGLPRRDLRRRARRRGGGWPRSTQRSRRAMARPSSTPGGSIAVSPLDGVHFEAAAHAALGRAVAAAIRDMEV